MPETMRMIGRYGPIPQLTAQEQQWASLPHAERSQRFAAAGLEYEPSLHGWWWQVPQEVQVQARPSAESTAR